MRWIALVLVMVCCEVARADGGAQAHANRLAASGSFYHASNRGGGYEGIGRSSRSADDAVRHCCYWGKRTPVDIGTAYSPRLRQWVAVVRYR